MNIDQKNQRAANSDWNNLIQLCMYAHPIICIFLIVSHMVRYNLINNQVIIMLTSTFDQIGFLIILLFLLVSLIIVVFQFIRPSISFSSNLWLLAYTLFSTAIIFAPDALDILPSLSGSIPSSP